MKIKTIKQIAHNDWDELVEETYGKIYSFQQQEGGKERGVENITVPVPEDWVQDFENTELSFILNGNKMGIAFETWLNTKTEDTANNFEVNYRNEFFWKRKFYPHINMIINDLYSKGLIEMGDYEIKIDW